MWARCPPCPILLCSGVHPKQKCVSHVSGIRIIRESGWERQRCRGGVRRRPSILQEGHQRPGPQAGSAAARPTQAGFLHRPGWECSARGAWAEGHYCIPHTPRYPPPLVPSPVGIHPPRYLPPLCLCWVPKGQVSATGARRGSLPTVHFEPRTLQRTSSVATPIRRALVHPLAVLPPPLTPGTPRVALPPPAAGRKLLQGSQEAT